MLTVGMLQIRCPMECRLSRSEEPWQCVVSLHFTTGDKDEIKAFGEPITDKEEVEERIRRAQRAILNPNTPPSHFLDGEDVSEAQDTFSPNCVLLHISGRDVPDLSFCDLPGMVQLLASCSTTQEH